MVGMARCAGCDAWPGSLRSSMRTSREACSDWGAVELSFLGATLSRIDTRALDLHGRCDAAGGSGPEVPAAAGIVRQLPRVRGRTPRAAPRGVSVSGSNGLRHQRAGWRRSCGLVVAIRRHDLLF